MKIIIPDEAIDAYARAYKSKRAAAPSGGSFLDGWRIWRACRAGLEAAYQAGEFLLWSNKHHMWWRDNESGYTPHIDEAGRYTYEQAAKIVAKSTEDGRLWVDREDPMTGRAYREYGTVMVPAPLEVTDDGR